MTHIKCFVFSTDNETAMVNGYRPFNDRKEFEIAQDEMSLYDDGASHFLMEINQKNFDNILEKFPEMERELNGIRDFAH